jgi:sulfate adenylyltransferase (ADP) / ATP adenylyltransferase
MQSPILYPPGTLWNTIVTRSRTALERGALHPIATRRHTVPDDGVPFQVRVVSSLARYRDDHAAKRREGADKGNPVLPYETDLFVTDVTRTHVCLLNKYNVIANHTLIVTRAFEHQESPLTLEDFQALWACLREFKALGFYNSGPGAGASQPHKHLQLVPLPLTEEISLPIAVLFPKEDTGGPLHIDRLPFAHTFVRLSREHAEDPLAAASYAYDMYRAILASVGLLTHGSMPEVLPPYNLLTTDEFMLLIPRSRASFRSIAVNALGFAGSFFVSDEAISQAIADIGPLRLLQEVTLPKPARQADPAPITAV